VRIDRCRRPGLDTHEVRRSWSCKTRPGGRNRHLLRWLQRLVPDHPFPARDHYGRCAHLRHDRPGGRLQNHPPRPMPTQRRNAGRPSRPGAAALLRAFTDQLRAQYIIWQITDRTGRSRSQCHPRKCAPGQEPLEAACIPYDLLIFEDEGHGIFKPTNQAGVETPHVASLHPLGRLF